MRKFFLRSPDMSKKDNSAPNTQDMGKNYPQPEKAKAKNRGRTAIRVLLIVILFLLVFLFIYSAYNVFRPLYYYKQSETSHETVQKEVVRVRVTPDPAGQPEQQSDEQAGTEGEAPAPTEAPRIRPKKPLSEHQLEASPIEVDFDSLQAVNTDVKAWLYCPDTVINYPVLQGESNYVYIERLYDYSYNPGGELFMDYRCASDFTDKNTIIYGHHMSDGSMLASLVEYASQDYYDQHPVMYLNTPDGDYRIDIVLGFVTSHDSRVYKFRFQSREEFMSWFSDMRNFSDFESEVEVGVDDLIVTLSTCTYEYDNARYIVMGKLVPLD